MWFHTLFDSMKHRRAGARGGRPSRQPTASRLRVEALEDRSLLSFYPAVTYPAGADVAPLLSGDLNGDHTLDLLAGGKVLLGNSDGTFQPAFDSGVTISTSDLADFNGDGNLDALGFDLNYQLGNGDGTFQPAQYFGFSLYDPYFSYSSFATGDINNDGIADYVLGWNKTSVTYDDQGGWGVFFGSGYDVFLGVGVGGQALSSTIQLEASQTADWWSVSLLLADFSGDGRLDLALTVKSRETTGESGGVALGNGDGTFTGGSGGYNSPASLVGDFNGDNRLDVARPGSVQLSNGDGSFQPPQAYDSPAGAGLSATGDFNGDGRTDLVTTYPGTWDAASGQFVGTAYVSVLLSNGDGTFQAARDFFAGAAPFSVAVADVNGDGLSDLLVGRASSGDVAVLLNDGAWQAVPSIAIGNVTVTEGNTGTTSAAFTVSLSAASSQPVTVQYATADGTATAGSDYQGQSGTLTFAPGETSKTVSVAVISDRLAEPNETFSVNLSGATNAAIAVHQGHGTVLDDDPRVSVNDVTRSEGNIGQTPFAFTVTLSFAYDVPVTVDWTTADGTAAGGSDYQAASGTLTFAPRETSKTITVLVNGDRVPEPNKTFFVSLSNLNYGVIADGQGAGAILDDEPQISISDVTKREGRRGTTAFTFTVTLSAAYDQAVTVSYRTTDGTATTGDSDYVAQTGTLTFAPGETSKTITVVVNGDSKKEANETCYIDLFGNSINSLFTKSRGTGTILNDD